MKNVGNIILVNLNAGLQELCRKCLTHNKSCAKAWEIQGLVFEKDSAFPDAAQVSTKDLRSRSAEGE